MGTDARIFIADDHPLLIKGLENHLVELGYTIVGSSSNGIQAYHQILRLKPDIAILDIEMPDMNGIEIAEKLSGENHVQVVLHTIYRDRSLLQKALSLGVKGYLLKEYALEEVDICLKTILRGGEYLGKDMGQPLHPENNGNKLGLLTPAETKILKNISRNKSTREIASLLFISEKTVEKHRSNIIKKLGLKHSTNSLLLWAIENKAELFGENYSPSAD